MSKAMEICNKCQKKPALAIDTVTRRCQIVCHGCKISVTSWDSCANALILWEKMQSYDGLVRSLSTSIVNTEVALQQAERWHTLYYQLIKALKALQRAMPW